MQLCVDYLKAYPVQAGAGLCVPFILLLSFLLLFREGEEPKTKKSKKKKKDDQKEKKESKKESWSPNVEMFSLQAPVIPTDWDCYHLHLKAVKYIYGIEELLQCWGWREKAVSISYSLQNLFTNS